MFARCCVERLFEPARRTTPLSTFEVQIAHQATADISLFSLPAPQGLFFYLLAIELVLDVKEKALFIGL
jgi:hypothetical protein